MRKSQWFDYVQTLEIEKFPTKSAAIIAEMQAIRKENPAYNSQHRRINENDKTPCSICQSAQACLATNCLKRRYAPVPIIYGHRMYVLKYPCRGLRRFPPLHPAITQGPPMKIEG